MNRPAPLAAALALALVGCRTAPETAPGGFSQGGSYDVSEVADAVFAPVDGAPGSSMALPGDVDGDGCSDVLVGHAGAGETWRLDGVACDGDHLAYVADATFASDNPSLARPSLVAGVGDVDADGRPDVAIASLPHGALPEKVYVHGGGAGAVDLAGDAKATIVGPATAGLTWDDAGIAAPGDVTGDGSADLVLGVAWPDVSHDGAVAYVVKGPLSGVLDVSDAHTTFVAERVGTGANPIAADIDGDGKKDVVIAGAGDALYAFSGPVPEGRVDVASADTRFAFSTLPWFDGMRPDRASAADMDADGRDDLVVPVYLSMDGAYDGVTVISGAELAEGNVVTTPLVYCEADDCDILAVDAAGDVDGDGAGDLVATVRQHPSDDVLATVVFGPFQDEIALADTRHASFALAPQAPDRIATAAGDVNGDGYADLLVSPDVKDGNAALILGGK